MGPFLDHDQQRAHQRSNTSQTLILVGAIGGLLAFVSFLLWGVAGLVATIVMIGAFYAFAPSIPAELVMRLYRAREVPPESDSQLSSLVDVLAFRAGLKSRPALFVIPSMTLNAFAAGPPQKAAIALTEGLLRQLSLREIAGVIAHEMSHIRNNDHSVLGLADWITRLLQALSYAALMLTVLNVLFAPFDDPPISWLVVLLLYAAPALSSLLQLALSRTREFDADLEAAGLTGDPAGLASALRQLDNGTGSVWEDLTYPVPGRRVATPSLLRSHPDTQDRINRLMSLETTFRMEPLEIREMPMISLLGVGPIEMRPRYRWPGLWF